MGVPNLGSPAFDLKLAGLLEPWSTAVPAFGCVGVGVGVGGSAGGGRCSGSGG